MHFRTMNLGNRDRVIVFHTHEKTLKSDAHNKTLHEINEYQ